jgi:hypothetical protein
MVLAIRPAARLLGPSFSTSASRSALSPLARTSADRLSEWKGTSVSGGTTKNFIGGEFVESKATDWIDILDPVWPLDAGIPAERPTHA